MVFKRWTYERDVPDEGPASRLLRLRYPDGMLEHSKVHWLIDPELDGKRPKDLRAQFQVDGKEHEALQYVSKNTFVVADEEVIASFLDENHGEVKNAPLIWAIHASSDAKTDPGNPDQCEGHYTIPLDKVGDF
ncbi:hypothetical protein IFR05_003489 [Cadophora sp. M221]|nr:hypothetical protein IFR05_003489 [Cadophora sp. M221]